MSYFVITGNERKQFESLRDALGYRTVNSRIYQLDAFGNLTPLNDELINDLVKLEQPIKPENTIPQQPAVAQPAVQVVQPQIPLKIEVKERHEESIVLRSVVYLVVILIIIVVAGMIIWPYWQEFQSLNAMIP